MKFSPFTAAFVNECRKGSICEVNSLTEDLEQQISPAMFQRVVLTDMCDYFSGLLIMILLNLGNWYSSEQLHRTLSTRYATEAQYSSFKNRIL